MKQKEYFGDGSIKNLRDILDENNAKNIFLVTGKSSYHSCGAEDSLKEVLERYNVSRFYDFEENPKIEDVKKGMSLFREFNPDLVIGVGGGTALDMAKLLNTLSLQNKDPEEYICNGGKIRELGKPLILMPTTSGTGSEATRFAVVYINKKKYSLAHEHMLPGYSIIDSNFTLNLPRKITASTGMDALSQAIESYWAIDSTPESRGYSRNAINLIKENLQIAVDNPTNESRLAMAKAANLAGKAINITKTTAPHAISYALTSYFGIPHGHAAGLTLGKFLEYNSQVTEKDCNDSRGPEFVRKTILELCSLLNVEDTHSAKNKIGSLMNGIGLETNIPNLGIRSEEDLDLIMENVNIERLINNPRTINESVMKTLLREQ
jgi:alcohol dehydrogenase class IV